MKLLKQSKEHLVETEWTYSEHLAHSIKQSNRLIVVALKSYVHGLIPAWYKADGPKTIYKIYKEIRKIRHVQAILKAEDEKR